MNLEHFHELPLIRLDEEKLFQKSPHQFLQAVCQEQNFELAQLPQGQLDEHLITLQFQRRISFLQNHYHPRLLTPFRLL